MKAELAADAEAFDSRGAPDLARSYRSLLKTLDSTRGTLVLAAWVLPLLIAAVVAVEYMRASGRVG